MKKTRIISTVMSLTLAAAPVLGLAGNTVKTITSTGYQMTAFAVSGQWKQSGSKWWFQYSNGGYPKNKWEEIGGKYYHFDKDGWMQTGWFKDTNGKWYYLGTDGAMLANRWLQLGNKWYYLNADGSMRTGWLNKDGKTYYLYPKSGVMVTGAAPTDKGWCNFKSDGSLFQQNGIPLVTLKRVPIKFDHKANAGTKKILPSNELLFCKKIETYNNEQWAYVNYKGLEAGWVCVMDSSNTYCSIDPTRAKNRADEIFK